MTYKIECEVEVPDNVTDDQVYEWASYRLNETTYLDGDNPLISEDLIAKRMTVKVNVRDW